MDTDQGYSVKTDSVGNAYVTGLFAHLTDFDPGPGEDFHSGYWDGFLSKFDSNGNFIWARTWGGDGWEPGMSVAVDDMDNPSVAGYFDMGPVDFDPGPGTDNHQSNGGTDAFLTHFDSSGNFQWTKTWGGPDSDFGQSVAVDSSRNMYVTGIFVGNVDFDPGPGVDYHLSNGNSDIFLSKFPPDGNW